MRVYQFLPGTQGVAVNLNALGQGPQPSSSQHLPYRATLSVLPFFFPQEKLESEIYVKSPEFYLFMDIILVFKKPYKGQQSRRDSLPQGHDKSKTLSQKGQGHPKECRWPAWAINSKWVIF